jgi:hypothetical protein
MASIVALPVITMVGEVISNVLAAIGSRWRAQDKPTAPTAITLVFVPTPDPMAEGEVAEELTMLMTVP